MNRSELEGLRRGAVTDEFDHQLASIMTSYGQQHKADDSHGDVTADSLVVAGTTWLKGAVTIGTSAIPTTVTIYGAVTFSGNLTIGGILTVTGFGAHTFASAGTGANSVSVSNTTAGAANSAWLQAQADGSSGTRLIETSTTYNTAPGVTNDPPNIASAGTLITGLGGGLNFVASNGPTRFYNGNATTIRGEMFATGGFSWGDTTDPGATNFRVAGTSALVGAVTISGLLTVNGFGTHLFTAGGTGSNRVDIINTTSGATEAAQLRVTGASGGSFILVGLSQGYTQASTYDFQSGTILQCGGTGGMSVLVSSAAANLRFVMTGLVVRGTMFSTGGFSWGDTTDPGASNFRVAGTAALIGKVTMGTATNSVFDQVGASRPLVVAGSDTSTTIAGSLAALVIVNTDTTTSNTAQLNFAAITGASTSQFSSATISCIFGARTNGQYPTGVLVFATSTTLNTAPTEKMRLSAAGGLTVGSTTDPGGTNLRVEGTSTLHGTVTHDGATTLTGAVTGASTVKSTGQPGFLAYNSSNHLTVASGTTLIFDTEIYDETSNFATNTFTAPLTGRYLLTVSVTISAGSAIADRSVNIVTSNRTYILNGVKAAAAGDITILTGSVIADMDLNDTATATVGTSTGTFDYGGSGSRHQTFFSGRLLV